MSETTAIGHQNLLIARPRTGVLLVRLNRPDRLNALTFEMFEDLVRLQTQIQRDPELRVVILTGEGRGFCAGLDLDDAEALAAMSVAEMLRGQQIWAQAVAGLRELDIPVIAAVNGPAAGAGMALALAADVRIASPSARFNAAFVRIGLSGGDLGTSWALPRIVGLGRAEEILLTGRLVDAVEAERIGLVTELVPEADLLLRALEIADVLSTNSPLGMTLTKQVVLNNIDASSMRSAIGLENRNQVLATRTHDMPEALSAFRQKRSPNFLGT